MSATSSSGDASHTTMTSNSTSALPPLEPLRMPSGPAFPEFVYRFVNKLFHLDRA
jgi:hypothetical protein